MAFESGFYYGFSGLKKFTGCFFGKIQTIQAQKVSPIRMIKVS